MAYNPTTWGSNDVITKDRLNKIEQGINTASKLSGTDIDADKDWGGKSITNVNQFQAVSANITSLSVSNYTLVPDIGFLCYSDPTTKTKSSVGLEVVKSATVPAGQSGSVTVYYNLKSSTQSGYAYLELLKNGIRIKRQYTDSTSFVDYTTILTVNPGDVIAIALESINVNTVATNNKFEIRAVPLPGVVDITTW